MTDFSITHHGRWSLLRPRNEGAEHWLRTAQEGQWINGALAIKTRDAPHILIAALQAGYELAYPCFINGGGGSDA